MKAKKQKAQRQKRESVGIIGLGYVGLPLACLAVEKGYRTIGFDTDAKKVATINSGKAPFADPGLSRWLRRSPIQATNNPADLKLCHTLIICVPTPVDRLYTPDLGPVKSATEIARKYGRKGVLVVLESTVNPGVCEEIVFPILSRGNRKVERDFFLAHCPERINPGDEKWTVRNIPRVVGGYGPKSLKKAVHFYSSIITGVVRPMRSIREAEAVKIMENSFRDVNIAFMNEMARSFDKLGIDILDVIAGASTKPFAFLPHYPSCGVGGHCIPVDPYYLIEKAKESGFDHKFLKLAREINNAMPRHTIDLLRDALNTLGMPVKGTRIGLLGLSYKANIGDLRESPSKKILDYLKELQADVHLYDPYFPSQSTEPSLDALLTNVEALVLATNHREFLALDPKILKRKGIRVMIDGKNALSREAIAKQGILYRGIGH